MATILLKDQQDRRSSFLRALPQSDQRRISAQGSLDACPLIASGWPWRSRLV